MEKNILTSVFMRFRRRLHNFAVSITDSTPDAEDALNEAFCKLWRNYKDVEDENLAQRLSFTAVRHSAIDIVRRENRDDAISLDSISDPSVSEVESDFDNREVYDELLRMAEMILNETQYAVFHLHDVRNLSYPEVSRRLGLSESNVRQILSRSRRRIREEYRKINCK